MAMSGQRRCIRYGMLAQVFVLAFTLGGGNASVASENIPDKYPESILYDAPRKVVPGVWSAIGATAPPTYENASHNNNLSFIVTGDGVVVVNAGASYKLAEALHKHIRKITSEPVRFVILENGQGHAMLGSNYWKEQGVPIIAHEETAKEISENGHDALDAMQRRIKEQADKSEVVAPDITFTDRHVIEIGGWRIEALNLGPAHSPGDTMVWLPEQKVVIAGDMAFHQRLLPIFDDTDTAGWIETWEKFEALGATMVVPGHGDPTDYATVRKYTRDYLVFLRARVRKLIDAGGGLEDSYKIDQSPYEHLHTFRELAARNAGRVFVEMEFD